MTAQKKYPDELRERAVRMLFEVREREGKGHGELARVARQLGVGHPGVLAQRLRAGKLVCLVCDRDVTGTGMEVEFFGEKARMMGGPAALAVQTGAALMPVILWFEGDHWGAHVHEQIPVPAEGDSKQKTAAMMQQVARLFEAGIRAHPQDWHMLQRVFAADLDPARLAAAESPAGTGRSDGGS